MRDVERGLGFGAGDQVVALLIETVKGDGRVFGGGIMDALHAVERMAKLLAGEVSAGGDFGRQNYVADLEAFGVGVAFDDEGSVLSAQEIGAA